MDKNRGKEISDLIKSTSFDMFLKNGAKEVSKEELSEMFHHYHQWISARRGILIADDAVCIMLERIKEK